MPMEAAKAMMLGVARQYEMGGEVEDLIRQMQPPAPQQQDKSGEMALQAQLASEQLKSQGLAQEKDLLKQKLDLGLREADLKTREAALQAKEELFRIQATATKAAVGNDNKVSLMQHKQVKDEAVGRVEQIAKEIDLKLKADAQSRATEKAANEKVQASRDQAVAKGASLETLLKDLHKAIEAMTKATLAPKERKLVKDKSGKTTGMVEGPAGG